VPAGQGACAAHLVHAPRGRTHTRAL
jgi:hypothetical protein